MPPRRWCAQTVMGTLPGTVPAFARLIGAANSFPRTKTFGLSMPRLPEAIGTASPTHASPHGRAPARRPTPRFERQGQCFILSCKLNPIGLIRARTCCAPSISNLRFSLNSKRTTT